MRIEINKNDLLEKTQSVISVITQKNTLPILSNILIETEKDKLRLTTTDLDIGMITTTPVNVIEDGAITISAKRFVDIIKELPDRKIGLYTKKNNTVIIESGDIVFKILGIPKDEFPKLPVITDKDRLTLKQADFKKMLNMTSFAMSRDETRYVLNGICFIVAKDILRMVATDGRRLAIIEQQNNADFKTEKKIIIPAKTIQELMRSLKEEGDTHITFSKNQVMFKVGELYVISRLIEGEFPNYEQAIPKKSDNKLKIRRDNLQAAIKRAGLLATAESQAIKLQLQKNRLTISKTTPEIGEVKEDIAVEYGGEDFLIGFNPAYLLDALKNVEEEDVVIELTGAEKPGVIRIKDNYVYIVLPMQIT